MYPNQKYSEDTGGKFKYTVIKLFHNISNANLSYWYYATSFLNKTCYFFSTPSLDGRHDYKVKQ